MAVEGVVKAGRWREKMSGPVFGALLGAALALIALLIFGWQTGRWYEERLIAERRGQITEELSLRAQALSSAVYRRFVLVEGLQAFTEAELGSADFEEKFEIFSSRLYNSTPGIRNIAVGPQGKMEYVYPLEGNELVIGYNPLNDLRPEVRADAYRAIETGSIVLSGPHELVQRGKGLIFRLAVYQDGSFWGFVNVAVDLQPILDRAGLDGSSGDLEFALRDSSGITFYGPAEVFERSPVLHRIMLDDGVWELAGIPRGGWQAAVSTPLRIFQTGSLVIILLFTSLVYLSINRQSRLGLTVRVRTREISQINEQLVAELAERKRIEANLRASEERLASLLDVAPDAIIAVDGDQKILVFNKAAETMFGYSAAEVLGEPLGMLLPERSAARHTQHVATFMEEPATVKRMDERLPIWGRRRDGGVFPAEASLSKLAENGRMTLTAIVRDITRRKKAEEDLQASESRNRALLNAIPDLILRISRDGTYLDLHAEKEMDLFMPLGSVIGANVRNSPTPPEVADRMMRTIEKVIREDTIETIEYSLEFARRIQTFEARTVKSGEDEVVAIVRNITERKHTEETLRKSQQRYEQLVNTIDGIVWEGDALTFQYSFVSKQAERLLGYPLERWTNEPTFWSDHIYAEDREWAVNYCALSTAKKQDHVFEYRMVAADGRLVWLRDIVTVVLENDQPVTLRGVMVDITESKRFEAELREREEQYRSVFESVSDALFINDVETGELIDFNPAASRMHDYTEEEFRQLEVGGYVHPESRHLFNAYLEAIKAGEVFRARAMDIRKDGSTFPIEVLGTSFTYRGKLHTLGVVRDITEEMKDYQNLEERVAQRTKELRTLLEISRNLTSTLDLKTLLSTVFEQLKNVVDFTTLTVWMLENEDEFVVVDYEGPLPQERAYSRWKQPLEHRAVIDLAGIQEPVLIPDVGADTSLAKIWWEATAELLGGVPSFVSSWMGIPLIVKNRLIGLFTFNHEQANYYTPQHAELALALANHTAVAIENARLFQTVQRGADQFRAISEMGQRITSILNVDELLTQTVHLIQGAFGYYHVHIGLIEGDLVHFPAAAGVWEDEPNCNHCASLHLQVGREGICGWVAGTGEPLLVPDISREPRYIHVLPTASTGSDVVLPLKVKGQVIGVLDVESREVNAFDESDVALLQSLANQVAVAIENARLYEQAQGLAALQERQKLARELHDSVSQALYGLALGTRTARTLLDRDPAQAAEPLDYCLSLAEAGLAEMRALIFELRPESLENEGLVAALAKQAAAVRARYSVELNTELCPEPDVPLAAKEGLYRIAQEAMNNTVKHARASRLELRLRCEDGLLCLEIEDDGDGFDPQGEFPGHLGLKSMRERAERLRGGLEIESGPGQGTHIRVRVPLGS